MSFASPLWLFALMLVPLALLVQRHQRGRARTYAVRFTAVDTLRAALGAQNRWRGQLPLAALLAALAVCAVALARPRITQHKPIRDASLMLVLDHSGSMAAIDVDPTRLQAAISAANKFIDQMPSSIRVGAVAFSTEPDAVQRPSENHAATRAVVDGQRADGGTDTGPALETALQLLDARRHAHTPAAIVLLSDGAANFGVSPVIVASQARRDRIPIYTVALGTPNGTVNAGPFSAPIPVPPDPQLMDTIASTSGGRSFDAQTAVDLSSIYTALGSRLSTVAHRQDITAYVMALAAAMLLVGAAGAVRMRVALP